MPKDENLQKHTLNLRRGDVEFISDLFASSATPPSVVIRNLIAKFVDQQRFKLKQAEESGDV